MCYGICPRDGYTIRFDRTLERDAYTRRQMLSMDVLGLGEYNSVRRFDDIRMSFSRDVHIWMFSFWKHVRIPNLRMPAPLICLRGFMVLPTYGSTRVWVRSCACLKNDNQQQPATASSSHQPAAARRSQQSVGFVIGLY